MQKFDILTDVLSVHEMRHKKMKYIIYLFGEKHTPIKHKKTSLPELLVSNIENTNKNIDIFDEIPRTGTEKKMFINNEYYNFNTARIFQNYQNCFLNKSHNLSKKIRCHRVDMRQLHLRDITQLIIKIMNAPSEYSTIMKKQLPRYRYMTYGKFLDKLVLNLPKICKQFKNINNKKISNIIYEYSIYNSALNGSQMHQHARIFPNKYDPKIDYLGLLMCINFYGMDLYVLGRLFRSYDNAQSAHNSIIITGNFHTIIYVNILAKLGFETVFSHTNYVNDGINISKLRQPLFLDTK